MTTILIISLLVAIVITFNVDLIKAYEFLSNILFGGKRLAPNETKF